MDSMHHYKIWLSKVSDNELIKELKNMDEKTIEDAFYKNLEFGTGGLRGVIGAGLNRMNIFTVAKATQGICNYLNSLGKNDLSVAIAYDSRNKSDLFSKTAAGVFAANNIKCYIFKELMPTPTLSFAVRKLKCDSGIILTASHNPAKYNGYKVYGSDGCQITLDMANAVLFEIEKVDIFNDVKSITFEDGISNGMIELIKDELVNDFLDSVQSCSIDTDSLKKSHLSVLYTPLNGTGNKPVKAILNSIGVEKVTIVPEQELPDGNFTTCTYPNPEERAAFSKALELSKTCKPDILLATDPDCDRVGVAVKKDDDYELLTGNETGCLLLNYILERRKELGTLPKHPVVVKTIVTSRLADTIAKSFGAEIIDTLTGFKFIGEQIGILEKNGEENRYIFGFEESYGCLPGTYVRDKDAVAASMLICEMAGYYKLKGLTLLDMLDKVYSTYGCYRHKLLSFVFEGADGTAHMKELTASFRKGINEIAGLKMVATYDYLTSTKKDLITSLETHINLPKSDVIALELENNCEVIVRPSGTEPKLKCYLTAKAKTIDEADLIIENIKNHLDKIIIK